MRGLHHAEAGGDDGDDAGAEEGNAEVIIDAEAKQLGERTRDGTGGGERDAERPREGRIEKSGDEGAADEHHQNKSEGPFQRSPMEQATATKAATAASSSRMGGWWRHRSPKRSTQRRG